VAVYVVDSSALVKRYVRESGTAWVCGCRSRIPTRIREQSRLRPAMRTNAHAPESAGGEARGR
jgi:hypothetical protein